MPVGVQVIARYGADAKALAAARFVEQALQSVAVSADIRELLVSVSALWPRKRRVHFEKGIVWIKWIGTHKAYDKIDVTEVRYGD